MIFKKRKSRLDKLDEQIVELKARQKENPKDQIVLEALMELKAKQLNILQRNISVLDEFMRNERENNFQ